MSKRCELVRPDPAPPTVESAAEQGTGLVVMGLAATQTDVGLVVHNVPIFCACARGGVKFDELWVKAATAHAMQRQREGYFPPLHIRHHEPETAHTDSVRAAGHFKIVGTGPITIGGARRTAILADLVFTDPSAAHEALTMRLPYRSVEIFDVDAPPSIDSLALLDHEAPFIELPMLQIGEVVDARTEGGVTPVTFRKEDSTPDRRSVVAFSQTGNRAQLIFREEPEMATPTEKTPAINADPTESVSNQTNFADDKPKDDSGDDENMEGDSGLNVDAIVKAIEDKTIEMGDMDKILAAIQAQKPSDEPEAEEEPAPAPAPSEAMKANTEQASRFAKLQGKVDALEANATNRDNADKRNTDVAAAMKRLDGRVLGSEVEGKLFKFHKEHGDAAFGDYVESLAQNMPIDPGDRTETAANFSALGGKIPEVVMKYQDKGVEAVEAAMKANHEFDELAGSGMRTTREAFIKRQMAQFA